MSSGPPAARTQREATAPAVAVVLLACFSGAKQATQNRWVVEERLRASGGEVLETTVVEVDRAGKVSVRDPRRVLVGACTSALTWGIFGLVSGGWLSLVISGVIGAAWGGWAARSRAHHLTGAQLARAGDRLARDSSALLIFTSATNAESALSAAMAAKATVASVACIAEDLSATIWMTDGIAVEATALSVDRLSMVLVRYDDTTTAREVASRIAAHGTHDAPLRVELVTEIDRSGRRRVSDPKLGAGAVAGYNARSWGVLGLVCGAVAGLTGGHGFVGFLTGGLGTGIAWGLFGAAAGALYGLWVGRAISARRLRPIAPLLIKNTSLLFVWRDAPPNKTVLELLAADARQRCLVLTFTATERGAVLTLD